MKRKLAAAGLSLALAAATMSASAVPAKADGLGSFLGGLFVGVVVTDYLHTQVNNSPSLFSSRTSKHVHWCEARYKTYNRYTDLYYYKVGKQRHCVSPYS